MTGVILWFQQQYLLTFPICATPGESIEGLAPPWTQWKVSKYWVETLWQLDRTRTSFLISLL